MVSLPALRSPASAGAGSSTAIRPHRRLLISIRPESSSERRDLNLSISVQKVRIEHWCGTPYYEVDLSTMVLHA
ncbi:hypothetical protein EJB05_57422 [Eragrostis curvula]|uniref:Uncharacterized protein n=1 Tax=Eragrostis curvula TaxID=38414 RepID=A0A5J9SEN3_9POAL|nr:hypothetical protein EJB05_57422 [Eragrostis curvula]